MNDFGLDGYPLPGLPLEDREIRIRVFRLEDEVNRQKWAKFVEPHLLKYNFPSQGTVENYFLFQKLRDRIRLAVEEFTGQLIGYVSFKPLKQERTIAELGICFAADQVSKGYGGKALNLVLPWALQTLNVSRIILHVDALNIRAIRLYERVGFRKIQESWYRDSSTSMKKHIELNGPVNGVRCRNNKIEILSWKMEWKCEDSTEIS